MLIYSLSLQDGSYYVWFSAYGSKKFSSKEDLSDYQFIKSPAWSLLNQGTVAYTSIES